MLSDIDYVKFREQMAAAQLPALNIEVDTRGVRPDSHCVFKAGLQLIPPCLELSVIQADRPQVSGTLGWNDSFLNPFASCPANADLFIVKSFHCQQNMIAIRI